MARIGEDGRVWLDDASWYSYEQAWLAPDEADAMLEGFLARPDWVQLPIVVFGREVMQTRLMTWEAEIGYRYSGLTMEPRPYSEAVAALKERMSAASGAPFNHILFNLYRDGRDKIAMHADNEPELGQEPVIASLSLGSTRRFVFQHRQQRRRMRRLRLQHGSLLIMGGMMQRRWRHAVPGENTVKAPRVNITARYLLREPPAR